MTLVHCDLPIRHVLVANVARDPGVFEERRPRDLTYRFCQPSPPPGMSQRRWGRVTISKALRLLADSLIIHKDFNTPRESVSLEDDAFGVDDKRNQLSFVILLNRSPKRGLVLPRRSTASINTDARGSNFSISRVVGAAVSSKLITAIFTLQGPTGVRHPMREWRIRIFIRD